MACPEQRPTGPTGTTPPPPGPPDADAGDGRSAAGPALSGGAATALTTDVLVIGGGIIGLTVAWRAAGQGLSVVVADPEPGGGAARVAAGMLAAVTELHYGEEALLELNLRSARAWSQFAGELSQAAGTGTGYRPCGTLAVALDSDDRAQLRELHTLHQRNGLTSQWLTGRECRRAEPMLAPGVRGGLRVDGDHQVDPRRVTDALLVACGRAGVAIHRASSRRLTLRADRVTGAELSDGTVVSAGTTVVACGSRSGDLPGLPEAARPPVRPVKGQVVRLRVPASRAPFLSRTVRAVVRGSAVYLVPRADGELVIGATSEEQGWDTTVTAGGVYELLRDAHELVPGLTELPLTETCAGLRPGTPDNAPLLGPSVVPGLHLATGHYRNGVLLAPATGEALAQSLTTGTLPAYAAPFGPERFATGAAPVDHPRAESRAADDLTGARR
ncbi:glycine oxidase ThiO [Streptomyces bohaiensis]|uniref:glycine oxidase n=1 Tax=Streptomyces bohaiensis TaxID=1431344 RepID=A0ABX1CBQ9_9ACTN|nr:glycine oxidase ThiO [Streptomyces bohaiensis]NJQ16544.1 glycine oxidase ThiO [Streptomyces bohaiensis]